MKLTYRKDIDGLRAVSVLAVLLNHAGIGLFGGGFIGVDVFFVISGFLITTIIAREIQSNDFSLIRFYERRIRRILPALFGLVAFTILACTVMYGAEKFKTFGKSLVATTLFASNFNFWKESGYFDAPSQLKPLLHTWSLAVEEQFYIVFPLFIILLYRTARERTRVILLVTALLSFGGSIYLVSKDPSAAFYLAPTRAWELLAGGLLALNLIPQGVGRKYNGIVGLAGLAMVLIPVFQYTENTLFPGVSALPPVLGAMLIIFSGQENSSPVKQLLSFPPLVFIGKISYSLYLWHWPMIIFTKYYLIRPMTPIELGILLVAIIVVSTLSWRFIESPFRSRQFLSTRQIYAVAASGTALMLLAGGSIYYFKGFPKRPGVEYLAIDTKKEEIWLYKGCNVNQTDNPNEITPCRIGGGPQPPSFLVWGDSHTPTYGKAIHSSAAQYGVSGILTFANGCPSLLNVDPIPQSTEIPCGDYNQMVLAYLRQHPEINTVILASRWTIRIESTRYKQEEGVIIRLTDTLNQAPKTASSEYIFKLGLTRTISTLQEMGRDVIIIAPLPEIGYDVPSATFIASRTGRDVNQIIAPSQEEYLKRNRRTLEILEDYKKKYGIQVIEPWKALCQGGYCRATVDGIPLYRDDDHLSVFGSEYISSIFDSLFESMNQASK